MSGISSLDLNFQSKINQAKNVYLLFEFTDDLDDKEMDSESEGEDGEDLQGVFNAVPSDNSDLIPPGIDEVFDGLPFSPIEETPPVTRQQPSPPATVTSSRDTANISTTVEVSADVHVSAGTNFDLDTTPTGWHVSYTRFLLVFEQ